MAQRETCYLFTWDEIGGDMTQWAPNGDIEIELTRGDDEALTRKLKELEIAVTQDRDLPLEEGLEEEDEDEDGTWDITSITHGPTTTTIEHRSDRNHLGITTIIWLNGIT